MARRRGKRTAVTIFYIFSGLVALSMVLGLIGPLVLGTPGRQPNPTSVPTWTPWPTPTLATLPTPAIEGPPAPPATIASSPTVTPTVTLTPPPPIGPPAPPTATPASSGSTGPVAFAVLGDRSGEAAAYKPSLDSAIEERKESLVDTGYLPNRGSRKRTRASASMVASAARME